MIPDYFEADGLTFTRNQIEAFIRYLHESDQDGFQSCYDTELEFYERNEFDPEIGNSLYGTLPAWVNAQDSPLGVAIEIRRDRDGIPYFIKNEPNGRDEVYCRALGLAMRNIMSSTYLFIIEHHKFR